MTFDDLWPTLPIPGEYDAMDECDKARWRGVIADAFSAGLGVACQACPFRAGAKLGYDDDAMEALRDGCEPSCHQRVGLDGIFIEHAPTTNRCRGYDSWVHDEPGFATPSIAGQPPPFRQSCQPILPPRTD